MNSFLGLSDKSVAKAYASLTGTQDVSGLDNFGPLYQLINATLFSKSINESDLLRREKVFIFDKTICKIFHSDSLSRISEEGLTTIHGENVSSLK